MRVRVEVTASSTTAKVLADRVLTGEGWRSDLLRIAAGNLLLVLCAWIVFPLPGTPVPVTGQTFGVLFVALLLGSRRGAVTLVLYLLEGLAGLPVFQPLGAPGVLRLAGPTAGYLLAYPAAAYLAGWLAERRVAHSSAKAASSLAWLGGALLAGELLIFTGGCAWLAVGFRMGWLRAVAAGALPFLPGELIKMALVAAGVRSMERVSSRA